MIVQAPDAAKAVVVAMEVLREALGTDARSWDMAGTGATVVPVLTVVPRELVGFNGIEVWILRRRRLLMLLGLAPGQGNRRPGHDQQASAGSERNQDTAAA